MAARPRPGATPSTMDGIGYEVGNHIPGNETKTVKAYCFGRSSVESPRPPPPNEGYAFTRFDVDLPTTVPFAIPCRRTFAGPCQRLYYGSPSLPVLSNTTLLSPGALGLGSAGAAASGELSAADKLFQRRDSTSLALRSKLKSSTDGDGPTTRLVVVHVLVVVVLVQLPPRSAQLRSSPL